MSALLLKTELLPVFSGDPSSHSSSTASGVPEGEVPGRSSVVILHHILHLQHRGLGRMRSVTLYRLAVQAAEPLMEPMSGLAELLPADGGVQLRLDTLAHDVPAQVLAGDLTDRAVGAAVVVRDDHRPAAERLQDVPVRLALLSAEILGAVAALLVPRVVEPEQHVEILLVAVLGSRADLAPALLVRGGRGPAGGQGHDGRQHQQAVHLGGADRSRLG